MLKRKTDINRLRIVNSICNCIIITWSIIASFYNSKHFALKMWTTLVDLDNMFSKCCEIDKRRGNTLSR